MVYQYAVMQQLPFVSASPVERYPKIVLSGGDLVYLMASTNDYLNRPEWVSGGLMTLEPTVSMDMTIGVDYSTLVMELPNGGTRVIAKQVPNPIIWYLGMEDGTMRFSVSSAYMTTTRVYRLRTPTGSKPLSYEEFPIVAEIDPVTTPGTQANFADYRPISFIDYDYHYFVSNDNGVSTVTTVSGPTSSSMWSI